MAGRDIGMVVLPTASIKLYLVASLEVRARRRAGIFQARPNEAIAAVRHHLHVRDEEVHRRASHAGPPSDAIIIDTAMLSLDEELDVVFAAIESCQ